MFFIFNFFADLCAAVVPHLFWVLHPRAFGARARRHKHGGNEQQSEERTCMHTNNFLFLDMWCIINITSCFISLFFDL